jgi:hypothetical protein
MKKTTTKSSTFRELRRCLEYGSLEARMRCREAQELHQRIWAEKQSSKMLLMQKLGKRYKIRLGMQEWIACGDAVRRDRLNNLVKHFKKVTGEPLRTS